MYFCDKKFFANYYVFYGNSSFPTWEFAHETEMPLTLRDITDARLRELLSCEFNATKVRIEIYSWDGRTFWHNKELDHEYTVHLAPEIYL